MSDAQSTEVRRLAVVQVVPEEPNAVRELLGFLGDPSWRVRKAALSRLPDFRSRPTLLVELIAGVADDTNAGLRSACCEALLEMGESVETLIAALHTTNTNQRRIVAEILGAVATGDATERLVATTSSSSLTTPSCGPAATTCRTTPSTTPSKTCSSSAARASPP